jgi:hypothetical protein
MTKEQFELLKKRIAKNPQKNLPTHFCIGKGNPAFDQYLGKVLGVEYENLHIGFDGEILPDNSGDSNEHDYFITRDYFEKLEKKFSAEKTNHEKVMPKYMPGCIVTFDNSGAGGKRGLVYATVEYVAERESAEGEKIFDYFLSGWHGPFLEIRLQKLD